MIRDATRGDIDELLQLGRAMWAEAPEFNRMPWSDDKVRSMLDALIGSPRGFVRVAERDGAITGAMVAAASEHWASDALVAFDLALYVPPTRRGGLIAASLVRSYAQWCRDLGVAQGSAGVSTGVHTEQTERFYLAMGARRTGGNFDVMGV
jgi:GNAT superfamily N-acetyltransferase